MKDYASLKLNINEQNNKCLVIRKITWMTLLKDLVLIKEHHNICTMNYYHQLIDLHLHMTTIIEIQNIQNKFLACKLIKCKNQLINLLNMKMKIGFTLMNQEKRYAKLAITALIIETVAVHLQMDHKIMLLFLQDVKKHLVSLSNLKLNLKW